MDAQLERLIHSLVRIGKRNKWLKYPIAALLFVMGVIYDCFCLMGELLRPKMRRRILAGVLSVCMVFTLVPMTAFAAVPTQGVGGLCEHHLAHTAECGYTEGTADSPCTHEHTEDCYQEVTDCIHMHTADCYDADAEIATDSDAKEPVNCAHICGEDTGCITQKLDCSHNCGEHDNACGYTEGTEGTPCTYLCETCNPVEDDAEKQILAEPKETSGTGWEIVDNNLTISTKDGMDDWRVNENGLDANLDTVKTATIAETVTEIPSSAFEQCSVLTNVTANGATNTGNQAFNACIALTSASFPAAKTIDLYSFEGCTALTSASFPKVETIGEGAFSGCSKLATLKLPAKPPSVANAYVFQGCPATRALALVDADGTALTGDALTNAQKAYKEVDDSEMSGEAVNNATWYGWTIEAAPVDKGWAIDASGNLTISTKAGMTDWVANGLATNKATVKTATIAETVTEIPSSAFEKCSVLTNVTANGATNIDSSAFSACIALTSASFPAAKIIDLYSFEGCKALTSASFPKVETIDVSAFYGCTALTSANFPVAASIGAVAFYGCSKLATLKLPAEPPSVDVYAFQDCPATRALALVDADGTALTGDAFTSAQAAYKAVNDDDKTDNLWHGWTIEAAPVDKGWAIDTSGNLTISTADGMTDWVENGWANTDTVKTATIAEAVTEIPKKAFYDCKQLEEVTAPGVTDIGERAFESCTALTSVTANGATSIGRSAFNNCTVLASASFPAAKTINIAAFSGCTALTNASFPAVMSISGSAFSGCTALTNASFPVATFIDTSAFNNCTELTTTSFPAAKTISYSAFNNCTALTSASFPAAKTISDSTFSGCSKLATLNLPAAPPSVKNVNAFEDCPTTRALTFVDASGNLLTGEALTTAQAAYKAEDDGDKTDNLWYGWKIEETPPTTPTVTTVAVTPNTANVQKGKTQQFTAAVTGTNSPAQTVTWKVTGGKTGTGISDGGLLTVAADETATTLTVTATSTVDTTKSGTAAVAVTTTPVTKYTLTVTGGTGSGSFEANAAVSISADAPEAGKVFDKWTTADGVTFADTNAATTTITMPAKDATVTATYKDTPTTTTYTITLDATGGSVSPASLTPDGSGKLTSLPTPSHSGSYRFEGWFTAAGGGTQVTTGTVFTSNATIYAHWTYTGGGDSGGSSDGGGSSSGGSTVTPPTTPEKENPSKGESTVTTPVDKNGNASVTVSDKNITDAIAQAKKDAEQDQPIAVSIKVETDKAAAQITATLPKTVQETLISNKVDSITIASNTVTMSFSQTAIAQMNGQAKSDITITAAKVDTGKLTGDAKTLIGSRPMYDFTATYGGGNAITSFGNNTVSIAIPYTLGAGETAGNIQAVYVDNNGKATAILGSSYDVTPKAVIFTTSHFSGYGVGYKQTELASADTAEHWAKADIEFVTSRGLLAGTGNNVFSPNTAMTKGMFVTALGRLSGVDVNSYKTSTFTDVTADACYTPYVAWAAEKNIVKGTTATTFAPNQAITRQEMAVIMQNYAKAMNYTVPKTRELVTFADNEGIGSWAAEAVKSMQMAGVIMGKDDNKFAPTDTATKAEAAAVIHRYVELVIDKATAQGLDVNDSGKIVYYENGKLFTGTKTIEDTTYHFGSDGICTKINAIVPDTKKYIVHKIVKGDTLWDIAVKNKCTVAEIVWLNGIKNPNNILVGTELKIPQK